MFKKVKDNLKYIKLKDVFSVFIFLIVLIPALILKLVTIIFNKKIWLVMESETTARDNGYHFYKYLKTNHPEINSYYVIDKRSIEYKKVQPYGDIIQYGSLKHWIYYIASSYKVSSQKSSNPAHALFYILHIYLNLFNNRVYLKHGIIKDNADWWHYKNTKYKIIICGARDEYNYIKDNFGYPEDNVKYTGLARFDNLHNNNVNNKQILIIPTWRNWLGRKTNSLQKQEIFTETDYYKNWNALLNDKKFNDYIKSNNLTVYFYPHINMKKYISTFKLNNSNIKIIDNEIEIQTLLKESALMVTDYSSVYMDFAYMRKPVIYFQFDKKEYRKKQYQEGYFSYEKNGFGEVIENPSNVVNKIIYYVDNNYKIESKYSKRMKDFFELNDNKNCERIYNAILGDKE